MKDARSFDAGAYRPVYEDVILGGGEPEILRAGRFSANVFGHSSRAPILGRSFRQEEAADGRHPVLISERLWTDDSDRQLDVGRIIRLGSAPYTVIGMVPTFQFSGPRYRPLVTAAGQRGVLARQDFTGVAVPSWASRGCGPE